MVVSKEHRERLTQDVRGYDQWDIELGADVGSGGAG